MAKTFQLRLARRRTDRPSAPASPKYKETASFVMSSAAFLISLISIYASQIKHLDELRVSAFHARYVVEPKDSERHLVRLVNEPLQMVFTNSGNREIAVRLILANFNVSSSLDTGCSTDRNHMVTYDTNVEPFVIKPQTIEVKTSTLRPDTEPGSELDKPLESLDLVEYEKKKKIYIKFCYMIELATVDETKIVAVPVQTATLDHGQGATIASFNDRQSLGAIYRRHSFGFFDASR